MVKSLKRAMTVTEQIDLLRSRGMGVDDALATQWLTNVSYYRLSAYWYLSRRLDTRGSRGDTFAAGTTLTDVVLLYEADRKLRTLVHDGMERIEVAMRTRIGEQLLAEGPLSYTDPDRFRPTFDHERWMSTAKKRVARAKRHNDAIKHYQSDYGGRFPFWVLAEVLDFADVSRLYEGLPANDQREIAEGLNIWIDMGALSNAQQKKAKAQSPLVRWMEQLTVVRNTCAHHGRFWNTFFTPAPTAALRTNEALARLPVGQSERSFGALSVMAHLLRTISPDTAWPTKTAGLLDSAFLTNPLVSPSSLGIPENWDHAL